MTLLSLQCMLSAIIVTALKGMFLQFYDLPKAWAVSGLNATIWVITFLTTVILDIEYGLGVGIILSIVTLLWRSNHGDISVLGIYADSELFADIKTNTQVEIVQIILAFWYFFCIVCEIFRLSN